MPNALLTVNAYSEKYNIPESTVYGGLYSKRIKGQRLDDGWWVDDIQPPLYKTRTKSVKIEALDDYELALLWLNGAILADTIILRSRDEFVPSYFAERFGCASWRRESGTSVCKISSKSLVYSLRELGFTGRKDSGLVAPDISDTAFAAAFIESRASFVRALHYDRRHPRDKAYAYYAPAISMCASYPIMEAAIDALHNLGIIPRRKLCPASNSTSASLKITSREQLETLNDVLSTRGKNVVFWEALDYHTNKAHQSYYSAKK